jgi:predicted site-specific integrase-resolvase
MEKRYMTVSEFAEKHGVPYQSAVRWTRKGDMSGVKTTQSGKFKVYMIPDDAKPPELPTDRPKKAAVKKSTKKRAAK